MKARRECLMVWVTPDANEDTTEIGGEAKSPG